jgi:hypothetical protein
MDLPPLSGIVHFFGFCTLLDELRLHELDLTLYELDLTLSDLDFTCS